MHYSGSRQYVTAAVGTLVVAILLSLGAILTWGFGVPDIGGKFTGDMTVVDLKKSIER